MTHVIALVGCGKQKQARPSPAAELYTGALFRGSLKAALALTPNTFVVSALLGVLPLDEPLVPYDYSMADRDPLERDYWGEQVMAELLWRFPVQEAHVHVWAGEAYVAPLRRHLPGGWLLVEPLAGLKLGQRLAALRGAA